MRKTILTLTIAAVTFATQLLAGGFILQAGNPEASPEALKAHAVVTIKAAGCHDPGAAKVTATAIGMVNGQRRSIELNVTKLSEPGMFAIAQQWPKEGKWVLRVTGRNDEQFTNTLIAAGPDGVDRLHAKYDMKAFAATDIDNMLR